MSKRKYKISELVSLDPIRVIMDITSMYVSYTVNKVFNEFFIGILYLG